MSAARGVSVAAALIAGAGVVAGCGSSPGSEDSAAASHKLGQANVSAELLYQSPAQATLSWFFAINRKDKAAVLAHFDRAVPSVHGQLAAWASECDHLNWPRLGCFSSRILAPLGW
jgi:hypothetical protein